MPAREFEREAAIARKIIGHGCTWSDNHKSCRTRKYRVPEYKKIPGMIAKLQEALKDSNVVVRRTADNDFSFPCPCISIRFIRPTV